MASSVLLKSRTENNIFKKLFTRQTTGAGLSGLTEVPENFADEIFSDDEFLSAPSHVRELDLFSAGMSGNSVDQGWPVQIPLVIDDDQDAADEMCFEVCKTVHSALTNFENRRSTDEAAAEAQQTKYADLFYEFGGLLVLQRVLMYTSMLPDRAYNRRDCDGVLRVKSMCCDIISKMVTTTNGEQYAKEIAENEDLLNYVFTLIAFDKTSLTAIQLIEDILQQQKTLNLNKITNLRGLILCLDDIKLAHMCRILSVTISDLDVYENKSSLFAQNKQKRSTGFINIRDVNQDMLLSYPDLLPRLVKIVLTTDYSPRYRSKASELDCWMEWIDNALSDDIDPPVADDSDDFVGGISAPTVSGGLLTQQPCNNITVDLIDRVQVVYVLGLFLVGKHRKKVQRKLAELKLIPGLSQYFDEFIWKCQAHRNNQRHRLRGHNASCECSPEVALKIQFLRLVHSFCDHSEFKHLLLTRSELAELKRINEKAAAPLVVSDLDTVNKQLMCKGTRGLLTKIVEVMKREPTASTFRFWLARAVESYLRGRTSYSDQIFLLRRGLLQHVASNIVDHDIKPKEILQSSFDLLGELVKFNYESFKAFDKVLCTKQKVDKFIATVNKSLVDSNMFLRSLMLSLEHFITVQPEHADHAKTENCLLKYLYSFPRQIDYLHKLINIINVSNLSQYVRTQSKLLTYLDGFPQQMNYIHKLVNNISVESLTQENVSCLNTTLVFLMFANRRNELPKYLRALKEERYIKGSERKGGVTLMRNFRELLVFWQEHYLHKDKDCSALEKSSRIGFEYWKETVQTLVNENRNLKTSVLHYVPPGKCRAN